MRDAPQRKKTDYGGSTREVPANIERTSDHVGAVVHNVQAHAGVVRRSFGNTFTVVLNRERAFAVLGKQTDHDVAGISVLDGVVHGLARDVVKVRGGVYVVKQHRFATFETAGDLEQILHFFGVTRQGGHEAVRIRNDGQQTAGEFARFVYRFIH